jgi:hypothetical protein
VSVSVEEAQGDEVAVEWNPWAMRVSGRRLVLTLSVNPLERP